MKGVFGLPNAAQRCRASNYPALQRNPARQQEQRSGARQEIAWLKKKVHGKSKSNRTTISSTESQNIAVRGVVGRCAMTVSLSWTFWVFVSRTEGCLVYYCPRLILTLQYLLLYHSFVFSFGGYQLVCHLVLYLFQLRGCTTFPMLFSLNLGIFPTVCSVLKAFWMMIGLIGINVRCEYPTVF